MVFVTLWGVWIVYPHSYTGDPQFYTGYKQLHENVIEAVYNPIYG